MTQSKEIHVQHHRGLLSGLFRLLGRTRPGGPRGPDRRKNKWAPDQRYQSFLVHARTSLDWNELNDIKQRLSKSGSECKYLDSGKWLQRAWTQARDLGLHDNSRLKFLDIGTGPGYVPYVAQYLGHHADALDMPGIPLYEELCRWLGVNKIDHRIMPFQPMPDMGSAMIW